MSQNVPYPSNRKALFKRWYNCHICGIPWPEHLLTMQRGHLVCPEDVDDRSHRENKTAGEPTNAEPRESPWTADGDQ